MASSRPPVGVLLGGTEDPEQILPLARLADELGFSEAWLVEDYFFTGGLTSAAAVLASTSALTVGTGIVSAMSRHPALLAMDIATISRMFPGRFRPGIGLGLVDWVRQMGLMPDSPLRAMRDCVSIVRRLLSGEEVTEEGPGFRLDHVRLAHPPLERIPIDLGVAGPRMVQLCGEIGDGLVVGLNAGERYVAWSQDQLRIGAAAAMEARPHRITLLIFFSVDNDAASARAAARPLSALYLALGGRNAYTDAEGITEPLVSLLDAGGHDLLRNEMPDEWLARFTVSGDPVDCAAQIARLLEVGVDSIVLYPQPHERAAELLRLAAAEIFPRL